MSARSIRGRRGMTLLEIVLALGLLSILIVPIYQLFFASVTFTQYASGKIEASNAALDALAMVEAGGTHNLSANADLSTRFSVTQLDADSYRIEPADATQTYHMEANVREAGRSPFLVPTVNFSLAEGNYLRSSNNALYLIQVDLYRESEHLGTYYTSTIE